MLVKKGQKGIRLLLRPTNKPSGEPWVDIQSLSSKEWMFNNDGVLCILERFIRVTKKYAISSGITADFPKTCLEECMARSERKVLFIPSDSVSKAAAQPAKRVSPPTFGNSFAYSIDPRAGI